MKTQEEVIKKIETLNADYKSGRLVSYKEYKKKYDALVRKANNINKPKTVAERVREFGARVKKDGVSGYYIYEGVNFKTKFNVAYCETSWWEINVWNDDCTLSTEEKDSIEQYNHYDSKAEVVSELFRMDQEKSKNK